MKKSLMMRGMVLLHYGITVLLFVSCWWLFYRHIAAGAVFGAVNISVYAFYAVSLLMLSRIYSAYRVGLLHVGDLFYGQVLSNLISLGLTYLLACALALFLVYLLAQRLSLRKAGFYGTVVAVLLCMLTTWFALGERREMLDDTSAVVMTASTAVKSSPDKSSTDLFVLHEGTVVTITNRLDDWCEVVIADGKKGWLECRKIETI